MTEHDLDVPPRRFGAVGAVTTASFLLGAGAFGWIVMRDDTRVATPDAAPVAADEPVYMEVRVPEEPAIPKLARNFDPEMASRQTGILGVLQQESGHYLASPYGGAFAVGNDDEDVWGGLTGTEIGEAYGTGGLGLVGTGRGGGGTGVGMGFGGRGARLPGGWHGRDRISNESYATIEEHDFVGVGDDALSTFSIDVDTASYSNVRRMLDDGMLPPADAVRIEELVNYFDYDYAPPVGDIPFAVHSEVAPCPWNDKNLLVKLGLKGQVYDHADLPTRNFVFLVDVSGSMSSRLPLVQKSLDMLVEHLRPQDRIGIVVYAGASGVVLDPTLGRDKAKIRGALARLKAGGSTNGGAGIELAYRLATKHFVEGGANRVILATDGDFNVGVTGKATLDRMIEAKRKTGVFLSVLGYGEGNLQDARMERLADRGNGNYAYIDTIAEAKKVLVDEAAANMVTIAKDVKIQVELDPREVSSWRLVGYENRKLAHQDFADDTKDAGEIGAGHTVTALYEIVPTRPGSEREGDLMKVGLRWKPADGDTSRATDHVVSSDARSLAAASDDFRLAAGAAQLGMLLRNSSHRGEATWANTLTMVEGTLGEDASCERAELARLVGQAARLSGTDVTPRTRGCKKS
jgi:Ca-activated chloride channel family protein